MNLPPEAYQRLVDKVGDTAQTVIPLHFCRTGQATVWVDAPDALANVVIRADIQHPMVFCYGDDMAALMPMLREAGMTRQLWAPGAIGDALLPTAEEAYGAPLHMHRVEQKVATVAPLVPEPEGVAIRRLSESDVGSLQACGDLQWLPDGWGSWDRLLQEGIAIGALDDERVLAAAVTFGRSATHDDIGVATDASSRCKGLCTACGAAIIAEILAEGRVPVWTVAIDNKASFRVSEKLGFETRFHAVGICPQ